MLDEGEKRAVVWGGLVGAATGSLLALLYRRWVRQGRAEGPKPIRTGQAVRLGISVLTVLRQFLEMIS